MRSCHWWSREGRWHRVRADAQEEIARSLEAIMAAAREMLGPEWPDPLFNSGNGIVPWRFIAKHVINDQFSGPMVKKFCLTVQNWFPFIYYKGNDRQKSIWPWILGQEATKGVDIGVALKFDS
jgi:hypothetical protein